MKLLAIVEITQWLLFRSHFDASEVDTFIGAGLSEPIY